MSATVRRDVFQAIADPTRRDIIGLVAGRSMNLNAIAENFDVSRPAISQHIKILTECGLIIIKKQGRERYCEASLAELSTVTEWVEKYRRMWEERYTALDALLVKMQAAPAKEKKQSGKKHSTKKKNGNNKKK